MELAHLPPALVGRRLAARASATTGNPLYVRPSVLILYREDHKFLLDQLIPKPGQAQGQYDLLIASQPYRARMPIDFKVKKVLAPRRLIAPDGIRSRRQSVERHPAFLRRGGGESRSGRPHH